MDPYKCDNSKLVQECNQLHLDLIEIKESCHRQVKETRRQLQNLENECNHYQLASSRNLQKIKQLEVESAKKSRKILELQGKCCKPVIRNVVLGSCISNKGTKWN